MTGWHDRLRKRLLGVGIGAFALALVGPAGAQDLEKVTLRTNWLFYGSHSIFFLGIDRGYYEEEGIDLVVKQGNGSSPCAWSPTRTATSPTAPRRR
jgi:ABC-type nitrate/sulfonate/bicarbonate transport system substrate-binding protein